ncbi:hypothetical protein BB561_005298 [Smittium simulii]|uniref:Uncharacterized protein n=1 Tax=Smittium simulii TaxID=133385 RepID=A0A2T9YB22_9FUNG|nr:hypothetical protein BB561_005298 [Smittium simulii]
MTRPIDGYAHKKLKDATTRIQDNKNLGFAHLIRELLLDSTTVSETTIRPIVENKQLDSLLAAKKPLTRREKKQDNSLLSASATAHTPQNYTPNTASNAQASQFNLTLWKLNSFVEARDFKLNLLHHMQDSQKKKLQDLSETRGRFYAHSDHQKCKKL